MTLKKLELSGFKSFANPTTLEFPSRITAIVGPNGSGKSNLAEALRWVLGEQSMKSLRGKRGEDLIWNGSPQVPRVGKASVGLTLDNSKGELGLDFEEVVLSRKIFRDGMNEYYLNNSQVRLKDIVELIARMGLGESKHNIIGQGEVDRILLLGPHERREMLEEALGLRVYQLKKNETERKLDATEQNTKQVEALLAEIKPHLKFLRDQAKKAEARGSVEEELRQFQRTYFMKERAEIASEKNTIEIKMRPMREKQTALRAIIQRVTQDIAVAEKHLVTQTSGREDEKQMTTLAERRREMERELGRFEAKLEIEKEKLSQASVRVVDVQYIQEGIQKLLAEIRNITKGDSMDTMRAHLHALVGDVETLLHQIQQGKVEERHADSQSPFTQELERTIHALLEEIKDVNKKIAEIEDARRNERDTFRDLQQRVRELDKELSAAQEEERDSMLQIERIKFDEERLMARTQEFQRELQESGVKEEELVAPIVKEYEQFVSQDLKKRIERLKGKLEEIGGIDIAVVKEYQDSEARHAFLTKELEDLKQARVSLGNLIKELDQYIKRDFHEGLEKIKGEFQEYFNIIFSGGKAVIRVIEGKTKKAPNAMFDEEMEEPEEDGIDISVDLPRKRIKSLAMLSGGERTLTSIALLLAIASVNPPPFLVLDETDAALDEANSQRYAAILKELAKRTQLLLVTHNRETMKCAGLLYGVTMGDDGVSKLLSLKLEEAEAYTNR